MESQAIEVAKTVLGTFAVLFFAGAVAAKVADWLKIPDVVLFLLIGILIGPPGLGLAAVPADSALNQLMLILGASFLLFHGGTSVSLGVLKQTWRTLTLLATLAVGIMTIIVGYAAHWSLGLDLMYAFLLAAVIASTDPATLVPIFLAIKIRPKVAETVLSESAFNDATGSICTFALLAILSTGQVSLSDSVTRFIIMAGGGILLGLVFGFVSAFVISSKARYVFGEYAQVLVLAVVIVSYLTAEEFGASGFMAVFVIGLIYGNMNVFGWHMAPDHEENFQNFLNNGSLLLRMIIFILLGTHVEFAIIKQFFIPSLVILAVFIFIARPLSVLACTLPDRRAKWQKNEVLFMFWTRETGVIPAALSGMLIGMGIPHADVIAAMTFVAILGTLVIQASTTKWLAKRLGLLENQFSEPQ